MGELKAHNRAGFTIVELLIVIVVIAILAAISVVAYTGIQNRAHDSAVKSDLSNFAKKVQLASAETGNLPVGSRVVLAEGGGTGTYYGAPQPDIKFTANKSAYPDLTGLSGAANFIYCQGNGLSSGQPEWAVIARGKSKVVFRYSSILGAEERLPSSFSHGVGPDECTGAGIGYPHSYSYGYFSNVGGWQSWLE